MTAIASLAGNEADAQALAADLARLVGDGAPLLVVPAGHALPRQLDSAVAVAPAGYAAWSDRAIRVIGAGFDGDPESTEAVVAAGVLAAAAGATLRIYAFVLQETTPPGGTPQHRTIAGWTWRERLERALEAVVEEIPATVRPLAQVLPGAAARGLAERTGEVDLMVLGTHRRGRLERVLFGSVAREVVGTAEAPVLIFPRGTAAPLAGAASAT